MEHIKLSDFYYSFTHVPTERILRNDPSKGFPT